MTMPRMPQGEIVDIMELDREIEGLRLARFGPAEPADRALALLLELRDDVGERSAALLESGDPEPARRPLPVPIGAQRRRRHHRWAVIPASAALVLGSTGVAAALSSSPSAPLYPLHRLIFGPGTASSASTIAEDLDAAQRLLNRAAGEPYANRVGALGQAGVLLRNARRLLPLAGAQAPALSLRLSAEIARLRQLETPPTSGGHAPTVMPENGGAGVSPEPEATGGNGDGSESEGPSGGAATPEATEAAAPVAGGGLGVGEPPETEPSASAPTPVATGSGWQESGDPLGSGSDDPASSASPGVSGTDR